MKGAFGHLSLAMASVLLSACHFDISRSSRPPTGQVAATVGGHEITRAQLDFELESLGGEDVGAQDATRTALARIVKRTVLADAARAQNIENEPAFFIEKNRVIDELLGKELLRRISAQVPAPTREEAEAFIADHPELFAERRVLAVDQIRIQRPSDPKLVRDMAPLKTLEDIEVLLAKERIPFHRGNATIDAVGQDAKVMAGILRLPDDELFILSRGEDLLVNRKLKTRAAPLTGDAALVYALDTLAQRHQSEFVAKRVGAMLAEASHAVQYNKDYAPQQGSK